MGQLRGPRATLGAILNRLRGLGYPERLISSLGAGACGVVGVGMFVVVVVASVSVVVSISVVAPPGGSPRWGARPTRDPPWAPPGAPLGGRGGTR